jgi:hypothetical protein
MCFHTGPGKDGSRTPGPHFGRSEVRKINGFIAVLSFLIISACIPEVKPILKPTTLDIPTRIANEQKWIDEAVAAKALTFNDSKPIQEELYKIKEKYNQMLSSGKLSAKDEKTMNELLDKWGDRLFRAVQRHQQKNY